VDLPFFIFEWRSASRVTSGWSAYRWFLGYVYIVDSLRAIKVLRFAVQPHRQATFTFGYL